MSDSLKVGSVVLGIGFDDRDVAAFEARLKSLADKKATIRPTVDTSAAESAGKRSAEEYTRWWSGALRERAALERQTAQSATAAIDQVRLAQTRARVEFERSSGEARGFRDRATAALQYRQALSEVEKQLHRVAAEHQLNVNQMTRVTQMQGQLNRASSGLGNGNGMGGLLGNLSSLAPMLGGAASNGAAMANSFTSALGVTGPLATGLGAVAIGVTAVGAGMAKAAKEAANFQQGMQGITSIENMSGAQAGAMASNFQKLSTQLPVTTEQLTGIARNATLLGVSGSQNIENFTRSVAMLGVATRENNKGFVDMSKMAEDVAIFLNETGSTAETFAGDMNDVVATLAAVDQVTPGTIQGLLNLTRYMASGAVTLNLSREAILSISGALTGLGANAEGGGSAVIRVLMAMSRAANGNRQELDALGERMGITKQELADMFEGQPTAKLEAFSRAMGVSAEEAKRLISQHPEQAFLKLAQGLHEAHARGENMTAIMDELGLKNVRDIRLIDQLIVGHNLLGTAVEAGMDKEKNRAQLSERVAKATSNFNDEMTKAKNATTVFLQNAGAPMLEWLTSLAKGWTNAMNSLSGYLDKLNDKRLAGKAQANADYIQSEIDFRQASLTVNQKVLSDPKASKSDKDNARRIIGDINAELKALYAELAKAKGEVAAYRTQAASEAVNEGLAKGTIAPPNTGGSSKQTPNTITGVDQLAIMLGMGGRTRGTPYGNKYAWGEHVGEDRFAPVGTPVYAPFTGNARLRQDAAQGNVVDLYDANGVRLSMIHLQGYARDFADALKAAGGTLKVAQGQVIGYVGQTGTSAHPELGPRNAHLHYHAYQGSTRLNPNGVAWKGMSDADAWARSGPGAGERRSPQSGSEGGKDTTDWVAKARDLMKRFDDAVKAGNTKLSTELNNQIAVFKRTHMSAWQVAEEVAAKEKKASEEAKKVAEQRAADQRKLSDALAAGKIADAERALEAVKRAQATELEAAKNNESKKAQIIRQSGPAIVAAGDAIANMRRDQAVKAAQVEADRAKKAEGADLEAIEKTRVSKVQEAYKAAAAERARNRADQSKAEQDAATRATDFEKDKAREAAKAKADIARASRELDAQLATQTVRDLEEARQRALENAGEDVNKRIAAEKHYGTLIRDAQKAEAQITYRNAMRDAANGEAQLKAQREKLAKQNLDGALTAADQTMASREQQATKALGTEVKALRGEYSQLADGIREKIAAGRVEDQDIQSYLESLGKLSLKVREAGMAQNGMIKGAQASAAALYQAAIDSAIASGVYADVADQASRLNAANTKVQASFETIRDMIPVLSGDFDEANGQLDEFLKNMKLLDSQSLLAAGVIDQLKDHIDDLKLAMQLEQSDIAAIQALQDLASDPVSGMDGGQAGEFYAKRALAQKETADDLLASMLELDQATLRNADSVEIWADMLANAGEAGGITADQLERLQSVLGLLKDTANLLPEDFSTFSEALKAAGEDGKYTAQELKDLADMLEIFRQNASDGADYTQYADVFDGAPKPDLNKPEAVGPSAEERAAEAARLRGLIEGDELLQGQNDKLEAQIGMWQSIIDGEAETGAISAQQAETLKRQLGLMRDMTEERRKAAELAAHDEAIAPDAQRMADLYQQFADGKVSTTEFAAGVDGITASLQTLADAGDVVAARLIEALRDGKQAARDLEDVLVSNQTADLEARNAEAVRTHNFRTQRQIIADREQLALEGAQRTFAREIEGLTEGEPKYKLAQAKLERAKTDAAREGVNARKQLLQTELSQFGQWASQAAGIFRKLNGDQENALSILADGVAAGFDVAAKVASGDVVGAVMSGIEAVMNLGESIANLNPGIQAWKKGLQEIAELEKQAMGSKRIGGSYGMNSIENPFYDKLQRDSSNRDKLASSKWYQRLGWSLFGGQPEVMKDDLAKTLSIASAIFNDFAQSAYSTLEDSLMSAIQNGDFSNISDNISKQIDSFVQRLAVQTVIAKSNLKSLIERLGEDVAAGRDTTSTIAAIRAEENRIANQVQALAPTLPGYAASSQNGSAPGGSLVGNAPSAQIGAPQFTLSLPPEVLQPLGQFALAVPTFARAAEKWERIADKLAPGGTPQLSNAGGLA